MLDQVGDLMPMLRGVGAVERDSAGAVGEVDARSVRPETGRSSPQQGLGLPGWSRCSADLLDAVARRRCGM